jgi:hypothetical protein
MWVASQLWVTSLLWQRGSAQALCTSTSTSLLDSCKIVNEHACHDFQARGPLWQQLQTVYASKEWKFRVSHSGLFLRFRIIFCFHSLIFIGVNDLVMKWSIDCGLYRISAYILCTSDILSIFLLTCLSVSGVLISLKLQILLWNEVLIIGGFL